MTEARSAEAALAAAIRDTPFDPAPDEYAAAILAAMPPGWCGHVGGAGDPMLALRQAAQAVIDTVASDDSYIPHAPRHFDAISRLRAALAPEAPDERA